MPLQHIKYDLRNYYFNKKEILSKFLRFFHFFPTSCYSAGTKILYHANIGKWAHRKSKWSLLWNLKKIVRNQTKSKLDNLTFLNWITFNLVKSFLWTNTCITHCAKYHSFHWISLIALIITYWAKYHLLCKISFISLNITYCSRYHLLRPMSLIAPNITYCAKYPLPQIQLAG